MDNFIPGQNSSNHSHHVGNIDGVNQTHDNDNKNVQNAHRKRMSSSTSKLMPPSPPLSVSVHSTTTVNGFKRNSSTVCSRPKFNCHPFHMVFLFLIFSLMTLLYYPGYLPNFDDLGLMSSKVTSISFDYQTINEFNKTSNVHPSEIFKSLLPSQPTSSSSSLSSLSNNPSSSSFEEQVSKNYSRLYNYSIINTASVMDDNINGTDIKNGQFLTSRILQKQLYNIVKLIADKDKNRKDPIAITSTEVIRVESVHGLDTKTASTSISGESLSMSLWNESHLLEKYPPGPEQEVMQPNYHRGSLRHTDFESWKKRFRNSTNVEKYYTDEKSKFLTNKKSLSYSEYLQSSEAQPWTHSAGRAHDEQMAKSASSRRPFQIQPDHFRTNPDKSNLAPESNPLSSMSISSELNSSLSSAVSFGPTITLYGFFISSVPLLHNNSMSSNSATTIKTTIESEKQSLEKGRSVSGVHSTDKRIFYFLHIHKSAGSTVCRTAYVNGMIVNFRNNCNVQYNQRCCGYNDTLAAQQEFAQSTRYTFVAAEMDMYSAMDTNHYRYILSLRNSFSRYRSHYEHVLKLSSTDWKRPSAHNDSENIASFKQWYQRQPDNFNSRKICGTLCRSVPKYQLTVQHFYYIVNRLLLFEDILLVEKFNETFITFANKVQWKYFSPGKVERFSSRTGFLHHLGDRKFPLLSDRQKYQKSQGVNEKGEKNSPSLSGLQNSDTKSDERIHEDDVYEPTLIKNNNTKAENNTQDINHNSDQWDGNLPGSNYENGIADNKKSRHMSQRRLKKDHRRHHTMDFDWRGQQLKYINELKQNMELERAKDKKEWDPMMSILDDALYEIAVFKYYHDNGKYNDNAQHPNRMAEFELPENIITNMLYYFERGPSRNCVNPCCSDTCSKYR